MEEGPYVCCRRRISSLTKSIALSQLTGTQASRPRSSVWLPGPFSSQLLRTIGVLMRFGA